MKTLPGFANTVAAAEGGHASQPLAVVTKTVSAVIAGVLPALGLSDLIRSELSSLSGAPLFWLVLFVIHDVAAALYLTRRFHRSAAATQAAAEAALQTAGATP